VVNAPLAAQEVTITNGEKIPYQEGKGARLVPPEETLIEEKSLEFDANLRGYHDPAGDGANGALFYAFNLAEKEKLSVQLRGENSAHLAMMVVAPTQPDKMRTQFARLERMPRALRSSRFEIQNIADGPYTVVVMVYGTINYWFKLSIERKL
jgi:hypothetical protein